MHRTRCHMLVRLSFHLFVCSSRSPAEADITQVPGTVPHALRIIAHWILAAALRVGRRYHLHF